MAKQGQHKHDSNDPRISKGHNNPDKSVTITTGSYKKHDTTKAQRAQGEDPDRQAQAARNEWNEDTRDQVTTRGNPRARQSDITSGRSGSDSNSDKGSRGY